jgi:hypothetical protein
VGENLQAIRFYLVLLLIFTIGRWSLGLAGVPYDAAHQVFSLVILTITSSLYYGLLTRGFLGGGIKRALALGAMLAIASQLVILVSTALSYMLGMDTYFNYPRALNVTEAVPFGAAMLIRIQGLVVNTILNVIAAAIGYGIAKVGPSAR